MGWEHELKWVVQGMKRKTMISVLIRVVWNDYIYRVSRERNVQIFGHKEKTLEQVLCHIRESVRFRLNKL